MKLVYVEVTVPYQQRTAILCEDEADLKEKLKVSEFAFRTAEFVAKPERDKSGKIIMHQMNKDWEFKKCR